jgi:DNA-binding transcriptional LysR family regulator
VTFRSDDNAMLVHFAASGMAAALVPRLVAGAVAEDLVALPAGHLFPPRRIGLIRHAHRVPSPAAERFIEVTQRVCATAGPGPELRAAASAS